MKQFLPWGLVGKELTSKLNPSYLGPKLATSTLWQSFYRGLSLPGIATSSLAM